MTRQASPVTLGQDILAVPAMAAIYLTVTVRPGKEPEAVQALADVPALKRSVGFRIPEAQLSCLAGIGAEAWDRMYDAPRPAGLHPLEPLEGSKHSFVSTPGDLFFHIRASRPDMCFELAHQLMIRFDGIVDAESEVHGFRYWDERDLLGFVDGTENPEPHESPGVVFVDHPDAYAGGSYVVIQKYLHDLTAWDALPVEEQERVIGRTKLSDIELAEGVQPTNSHVAANQVYDADGDELQIFRQNLPFGAVGEKEFGTLFIGYAADPSVTEQMLRQMFIGNPPGNYDRILDFSTAVTGCLFFLPPLAFLDDPAPFLGGPETATTSDTTPPDDGSLSIGSLKE